MSYAEWDWDECLRVKRLEAWKEGFKQGFAEGFIEGLEQEQIKCILALKDVLTPKELSETMNVSLRYVKTILASEQE